MLNQIAQLLFNIFVINRRAIAVQKADGNYITHYTNVTKNDIYCMLKEEKSIGTYQQLYKSPYLKWICLDFDCKDKENPNLNELYRDCIYPINNYLFSKKIKYINEFSGRRGIHIWIIFDSLITKQIAYDILQKIISDSGIKYDVRKYGLDKFPANGLSKNNIVGKQVKIPLSKHKKGQHSFLFEGEFSFKNNEKNPQFFENQFELLNKIEFNNVQTLINTLGIISLPNKIQYKKILFDKEIDISLEAVIDILSQTNVYRGIFERFQYGQPLQKDWFVLLGTFGRFGKNSDFLLELLQYTPNYSEEKSKQKIKELGYKYFPATFQYLYDLYDLNIEAFLNPAQNALEFLAEKLNKKEFLKEYSQNETFALNSCRSVIEKEKNYLFTNDEVPVVSIYLDLLHFSEYDIKRIDTICDSIVSGEEIRIGPSDYLCFKRTESSGKERNMVSLSAYDRVLTTHLTLKLFYHLRKLSNSFSYNPNYLSENMIFFHWFPSWGNYLESIRKYLNIDLYESNKIITLDISKFYDSIDFLGVYSLLQGQLTNEENNIIKFLIFYNEKLMQQISNSRIGVPQGPAYARLIAEAFLGIIINKIKNNLHIQNIEATVYRYVDDIIIFCTEDMDEYKIYKIFENELKEHGLILNSEKSHIYGQIKKLTENERNQILRKGKFQYFLNESDFSYLIPDEIIRDNVNVLIKEREELSIFDISCFFSNRVDSKMKKLFFEKYGEKIFSSTSGRGSNFNVFYNYIFSDVEILEKCIEKGLIRQLSSYGINFSSFISMFYYAILNKKISDKYMEEIINEIDIANIKNKFDDAIFNAIIAEGTRNAANNQK